MSAPLDDLMGNSLTEPIATGDEEEIEVSVVDDRPVEDQVEESDSAGSFEEEIDNLGGRASKRISRLKREWHEQRRSKEASERMRDEAVTHAQRLASENGELKELLKRGEKVLLSEIKSRTEVDLGKSEQEYKQAYESGDTDAILKAQKSLTRSQYETEMATRYEPEITQKLDAQQVQQSQQFQQAQQVQQAAQTDPKLQSWLRDNDSWFGKDEEMTSFAYGVHERLVRRDGVHPQSDEYYEKLNDRLRTVFNDRFGGNTGAEEPSANSRSTTVVAPATRSSGRPRQVQLSSTQVKLAKRLGITPQQYAKQLVKEFSNG